MGKKHFDMTLDKGGGRGEVIHNEGRKRVNKAFSTRDGRIICTSMAKTT